MKDKNPTVKGSPKSLLSKFRHLSLKRFNRNTILAGSLVAVLLVVGVWSIIFNKNTSNQMVVNVDNKESVLDTSAAPAIGATVSYMNGVVEYKNEQGAWTDAEKDTKLITNMGLRTVGAASKAIVTLEDGSAIRLDANTEVTFDSLTKTRVIVAQQSGNVYNRVAPSDSRAYIVHTKEAQFQSVGTAFRTIASGDEEAVEVFQSSVKETSTNITTGEGEKLIVKSSVNPEKDETKEKIDIEKLKVDSFITWNREEDQKDKNFKSKLGFLSDFDGPKIEISEPVVGSSIEVDGSSTQGAVTIKGKTESKATLTVQSKSISGSNPVNIDVADDGSFDTGVQLASIGNSIFELIATDKVGNKTTLSINYVFKRKTTVQEQGIALTLDKSDPNKLKFDWALVGLTTPDGVKIVYSKSSKPTFPEDSESTPTINTSELDSGETYYFRACRYVSSSATCDVYSNEIVVDIP